MLEEALQLIRFANGELGVEIGNPLLKSNVNPQNTEAFAKTCQRRPNDKKGPEYDYQRRILGPNEIIVSGGGTQVEADGIDAPRGYLQDAKFVTNPKSSLYMQTTKVEEPFLTKLTSQIDDLFFRYGEVIRDPRIPIRRLEVFVDRQESIPFFQKLMLKHKIPGRIVVRP